MKENLYTTSNYANAATVNPSTSFTSPQAHVTRQIASRAHYFYQIVESCLQLRILASLVTNVIPSASAVAPIRRSHGSLE
jgi:hypothetical protein